MDADVIVIGAGPAGLCAAAELRRAGADVLLLERNLHSRPGSRAIGVHGPVLTALEASGATETLLAGGTRIHHGVARAGGRELGRVSFDRPRQRHPFALALPQAQTEAALRQLAPPAQLGCEAVAARDLGGRVEIDVRGTARDRTLTASLAVVAGGAAGRAVLPAPLAPALLRHADRYLMADVAAAPTEPDGTAVITLAPGGVVESFPLPAGGRRLVAWICRGGAVPPGDADALLRSAIAERNSGELADHVSGARAFGIRRALLPRLRLGRILAIGDAAHEVSPIGGQGMNLGLLDAVGLAPAALAWLSTGDDRLLRHWEARRLVSARRAAALADLSTRLGRPKTESANRALSTLVAALLASPASGLAARAFSMGFDRDARPRR